jgi:hypothetical protein
VVIQSKLSTRPSYRFANGARMRAAMAHVLPGFPAGPLDGPADGNT